MHDLEFNKDNILPSIAVWKSEGEVSFADGVWCLGYNGKISIELNRQAVRFGGKYFKSAVTFKDLEGIERLKGYGVVTVKYVNGKEDNVFLVYNRDVESVGLVEDESIIKLRGANIESIKYSIYNVNSTPVYVTQAELYKSIDIDSNQVLVDVEVEPIITADVAMLTSTWADNMFVQELSTNIWSASLVENYISTRDYITIKDRTIGFYQDVLDADESKAKQLQINTKNGLKDVWYTAVGGEQAYMYVTINHPTAYNKNLTEAEVAKFRYMIRGKVEEKCDLKIHFIEDKVLQEDGTYKHISRPVISFGDADVSSSVNKVANVGRVYKDEEGFKLEYVDTSLKVQSIQFTDKKGVLIDGGSKLESVDIEESNGLISKFKVGYSNYALDFSVKRGADGLISSLDTKDYSIVIRRTVK